MANKRIYSLNLAAYVQMETNCEPALEIDYSNGGNGLVCCVFPECDSVSAAINAYKQDRKLHLFLNSYRELRQQIKEGKQNV